MGEIRLNGFICDRCTHTWVPRVVSPDVKPTVCPKCKSPYWNVPRKNGIVREEVKKEVEEYGLFPGRMSDSKEVKKWIGLK